MKSKFIQLASGLVAGMACVVSCVEINEELGKEYIPTKHMYDVYTDTVFFKDIEMRNADRLSGYSSSRITIGAVRDDEFGLTTRGSAFTLIPVDPDMDFGENPVCTQFHFTAVKDTLSYPDESQAHIIQNVYVYRLEKNLGEDAIYADGKNQKGEDAVVFDKGERIAPVFSYFGQDSLSFDFNIDFGQSYIDAIRELQDDPDKHADSVSHYVGHEALHGIYIETGAPTGNGGRINMFDLPILVTDSYYIGGNYAELKFRAEYDYSDEPVDTSFLFFFGAQDMSVYQESQSSYATPTQTPQYALNVSVTEGRKTSQDENTPVSGNLYIEGGSGVKPVISAREIQESLAEVFAAKSINPEGVIIHKATIVLPYDFDVENYDKMYLYPDRLSPTCCITTTDDETEETRYSFAGLTDASVSTENQGDINRSLNCYSPDISHHVQEILKLTDDDTYSDYDIWMLTMAEEVVESSSDGSSMSDYYQNLAYYDYYNSLYNPYGYGGYYGGYYGYGYDSYYGMSNYYNYMLAAQYASSQSSSTTTTSIQLDKDRYYRGVLRGIKPETAGDPSEKEDLNYPRLVVTYSVSKTME